MKMEESAYIPSSIPPGLVVFSQPGYSEAMRLQRPFTSQVSDAKETLNLSTLSSSSFGFRSMESFGGLPAQLVHLQQNPFLHPALEGRFPFGSSGAFRPLVSTSSSGSSDTSNSNGGGSSHGGGGGSSSHSSQLKNLPSAFTSPNQSSSRRNDISQGMDCRQRDQLRSDQQDKSSTYLNGGQSVSRRHSPTAGSPSMKNVNSKEERDRQNCNIDQHENLGDEGEGNGSPNSDQTDRSSPEESQIVSKRRRKGGQETLTCPVCKMALRPIDLESHLLSEVEQLMCMSRIRRQQGRGGDEATTSTSALDSPSGSNNKNKEAGSDSSQDSRWDTYHRVRANRHSRLRGKTKRRREDSGGPHVTCPVCQLSLQGSNEQFSAHVEACLRKNGDMLDEDEPVDIEGDGDNGDTHEMDDYAWIGHRRSRTSPNNYCAINMTTNSRRREEESETLEVVVDGDDDGASYGGPQYTDSDIHAALTQDENSTAQHDVKVRPWEDEDVGGGRDDGGGGGDTVNSTIVIQALKGRVRELETKSKGSGGLQQDGNHCLICMDKYKKSVVSTVCWHVHCENCWLKTLGTKKLCPQCNAITSPGDLRRIYL